ncbi:MAG: hypothetical protein HY606_12190 [Planctomycetes bacterium]|nr:hypothetical protein [Planctomycetota bacterium]
MPAKEALKLASESDQLYVAKGQKIVRIDLKKENPGNDTLLGLILGPSGNLRAPTIRNGKTLIVGFNEEMYKKVLSKQ